MMDGIEDRLLIWEYYFKHALIQNFNYYETSS